MEALPDNSVSKRVKALAARSAPVRHFVNGCRYRKREDDSYSFKLLEDGMLVENVDVTASDDIAAKIYVEVMENIIGEHPHPPSMNAPLARM